MSQSIFEKEDHLKDLVVRLLKDRNLSDCDVLDSLFQEIKQDFENQVKSGDLV